MDINGRYRFWKGAPMDGHSQALEIFARQLIKVCKINSSFWKFLRSLTQNEAGFKKETILSGNFTRHAWV